MSATEPIEILLVEDNPDDVELALYAFQRSQIANNIKVVRDGEEALAYLFRTGPYAGRPTGYPKMMLLDLKLPKVTGIEVLQQVRADPKWNSLPVVVMTSSREDRDLKECYALGVNSYIVKPVDFAQFAEVVGQLGMYWVVLNETPSPIEDA